MIGSSIAQNLDLVIKEINFAKARRRDTQHDVRLIAVSKRHSTNSIKEALIAGQLDFGENYVQEAMEKMPFFEGKNINWHFIGGLQRNKCKKIVGHVSYIHTVDRLAVAREISKWAQEKDINQKILLEINFGEKSKSGAHWDEIPSLIEGIIDLPCLKLEGLMALPPLKQDPEEVRPYFRELVEKKKYWKRLVPPDRGGFEELSMGTSGDFSVAIEEGATMIRVGTAIFGERTR